MSVLLLLIVILITQCSGCYSYNNNDIFTPHEHEHDIESGLGFDPESSIVKSQIEMSMEYILSIGVTYSTKAAFCVAKSVSVEYMESMVSYYSEYIYSLESFQEMLVARDFLPNVERIIISRLYTHFRRHSSNHSWTRYHIFLFVGMSILEFILYLESTLPYELDWSYFIAGKSI